MSSIAHKLVSTRDTRVIPREGRKNYEMMKEKREVAKRKREVEPPIASCYTTLTYFPMLVSGTVKNFKNSCKSFLFDTTGTR